MKVEKTQIKNIPSIIYGNHSSAVYLFVHGKSGFKEEAEEFANIASPKGWQVLAIDLPEHGERKSEKNRFNPWCIVPELHYVMNYIHERWNRIGLRANSIGAWFSMIAGQKEIFEKCLFVSPVLNMEKLILNMMIRSGVTEEQLRQRGIIETSFGEILSWKYLDFVRQHRIEHWSSPTAILYADQDNLTDRKTIDTFVQKYSCQIFVMTGGEHWFHTEEQMQVLHQWTENNL